MKKKRAAWVVGIIAAAVILPPLTSRFFVTWSELNCSHQEINIKTGRARFSRYIWFIKVSQRVEDTALSLALEGDVVDVADIEAWQFANTFSPGVRNSPHYRFHSALHQAGQLEKFDEIIQLTGVPKKVITRKVLTLWQEHGNYRSAEKYINGIIDRGLEIYEERP